MSKHDSSISKENESKVQNSEELCKKNGQLQINKEDKTKKKIITKDMKRCSAKVHSVSEDSIHNLENRNGNKEKTTPLRYCVFIANHPFISLGSTLVLHTSVIVITVVLMIYGYTVFPIEFDELPLILYTDIDRTKDIGWRDAFNYDYRVHRPVFGLRMPYWYNGKVGDTLEVIFEGDNVYSQSNLEMISDTESRIFNFPNFQSTFCLINNQFRCEKPVSILRLFDGTYQSVDPIFGSSLFENASDIICRATKYNETKEFVQLVLEKNYNPCDTSQTSSKTRSFVLFGWPLRGPNDGARLSDFQVFSIKPELEHLRDSYLNGKLQLYYMSVQLFEYDVKEQAMSDMKLAIGSFCFIFLFMLFQTASLWITFFGILSIVTSFLLTNLIYRFVFGYEYFGFFHIISIFIILGIGADDVFIFYDTWRLSGHTTYPSKAHRLSDCYRKAAKTTFVTSVTTMSAFLVSYPSPLLPVRSFGLFSGLLVGINYLFDLFCFPVVILVYSETIKPIFDRLFSWFSKCFVCLKDSKTNRTFSQQSLISSQRKGRLYSKNIGRYNSPLPMFDDRPETPQEKKFFENRNKVVLFLKNGFYDFMTLRIVKIVIPLLFIGCSIFFIHKAATIEPDSNQVEIFVRSHNYGKAYKLHYYGFQRNYGDEDTRIHLSWGVKPQIMNSCELNSKEYCRGETQWDDTFDASSEEAQTALMNLCIRLENLTDTEIDQYKIKRNPVTKKPEISCFMSSLYRYFQNWAVKNLPTNQNQTVPFPFTKSYVTMFMKYHRHIYDVSALPLDFDRWLEIAISYWLSNRYTAVPTEEFWLFNHLIGEEKVGGVTKYVYNPPAYGMVYGTKLKVIGIEINTTLSYFTLGYPEGKPVRDLWEEFITSELKKMPASLQNGFQSTLNTWHWIKVQETLVNSAVTGLAVGISLALPILIFTTLNVVIGFLATVCIGLITTIVVGIIPLAGWKLGVLESLNLGLVVGLSVDYVVHLAEAYRTSPSLSRDGRVRNMLESMGLSVLSGGITTFGAAVFMLFAKIKFLYQFGIFVMCTVGISLLFSFIFFTSFMALCGPQGNTGSLSALYKMMKSKFVKQFQ